MHKSILRILHQLMFTILYKGKSLVMLYVSLCYITAFNIKNIKQNCHTQHPSTPQSENAETYKNKERIISYTWLRYMVLDILTWYRHTCMCWV